MKTITVRLTDGQAEALNRLSYIEGKSKNAILRKSITDYYNLYDLNGSDGEVVTAVTPAEEWPRVYVEEITENKPICKEEYINTMKIYNYAIEHAEDNAEQLALIQEKSQTTKKQIINIVQI